LKITFSDTAKQPLLKIDISLLDHSCFILVKMKSNLKLQLHGNGLFVISAISYSVKLLFQPINADYAN